MPVFVLYWGTHIQKLHEIWSSHSNGSEEWHHLECDVYILIVYLEEPSASIFKADE